MNRIAEAVTPARLGVGFRWLLASSWASNLGDGIVLAAGPLLVASQTSDAFLIALASLLLWLPPLVFGLYAGAIADRLDRRLIVIVVDVLRAGILAALCLTIVTGTVSIGVVLVCVFLLGTAEVFADTTAGTLLPSLVRRDDLVVANARLTTGFVTVNQLAGPPLGASLFVAGMVWPFVAQAVLLLLGALLVSRIVLPPHVQEKSIRLLLRRDIAEGARWAWRHPAIRTLIVTIFTFNITYGAAWSVLVLYATQRLGLGEVGFGLLTTVAALGGLLGIAGYGALTRQLSLGAIMRIGLILETLTHLALALTRTAWVAMTVMFVFGAHAFVWGTTSTTVRQRAVPLQLQGRISGVNRVFVYGGLVLGSGIGGLLAREWGVTAPFWFAFAGSALFLVLIWGALRRIDDTDAADTVL